MRRLIVNADDFGFTPGVTAGILEAHAAGTVPSTSMMVGCAGWDDAVRQARAVPALDVGLHFNLLVGTPIAAVRSLVDRRTGRFLSLTALVRRALTGRIDPGEVTAECEAQLSALGNAGIRCTHIDSHRHTHALPVVRGAIAAIARRRSLPLRRPVETQLRAGTPASHVHRGVVSAAWRVTSVGAAHTRAADHFAGVALQGAARFQNRLEWVIDRVGGGTTELMVHPGRVDDALLAVDRYTWARERELAALLSPGVRERLLRGSVELVGFRALQGAAV